MIKQKQYSVQNCNIHPTKAHFVLYTTTSDFSKGKLLEHMRRHGQLNIYFAFQRDNLSILYTFDGYQHVHFYNIFLPISCNIYLGAQKKHTQISLVYIACESNWLLINFINLISFRPLVKSAY